MQWEYNIYKASTTKFVNEANEDGKDGWELVSAVPFDTPSWVICIFKRPIPETEKTQPQPDLQIIGNMPPATDLPPQTSSADFPPQHEGGIPYCDKIIKARERRAIDRQRIFISNAQYRIERDQEYIQYCLNEKDANNVLSFCQWDDWQDALKGKEE